MKLLLISALVSVCAAYTPNVAQFLGSNQGGRARSYEGNAAILRSDAEVNDQGFHYAFETDNGIQAEESGREADGIQAAGGYSYTGDDGVLYSVRYTADSNGFQAQGAHIPTAPPVPEEIIRALEQNARDEANGIFDDGSYNAGKYGDTVAVVPVARAQFQPTRQFQAPQSRFNSRPRYF